MATPAQWIEGARLRTLPMALAPVVAGSAAAQALHSFDPVRALLALLVALLLQIGVNYANDYSDGIRGTDDDRVGPLRLTGSGAAAPGQVRAAALLCFGLAALAGAALVVLSRQWWFIPVGLSAVLAAWGYTGGRSPYGYRGLGDVFVFVYFGLVAVLGTTLTQAGTLNLEAFVAALSTGLIATALLMANNIRDLPGDREVGKRTWPCGWATRWRGWCSPRRSPWRSRSCCSWCPTTRGCCSCCCSCPWRGRPWPRCCGCRTGASSSPCSGSAGCSTWAGPCSSCWRCCCGSGGEHPVRR